MGNYTIFGGVENPRRGRQTRNLTTNVLKILSQIVFRTDIFQKLLLGASVNEVTCHYLSLSILDIISRVINNSLILA